MKLNVSFLIILNCTSIFAGELIPRHMQIFKKNDFFNGVTIPEVESKVNIHVFVYFSIISKQISIWSLKCFDPDNLYTTVFYIICFVSTCDFKYLISLAICSNSVAVMVKLFVTKGSNSIISILKKDIWYDNILVFL